MESNPLCPLSASRSLNILSSNFLEKHPGYLRYTEGFLCCWVTHTCSEKENIETIQIYSYSNKLIYNLTTVFQGTVQKESKINHREGFITVL